MNSTKEQVVPGVWITPQGQVFADESLSETLCDLALELEEEDDNPVDVQHVLAAVVLAARQGQIAPDQKLASADRQLRKTLSPYVKKIFEKFDGDICGDD